jgi:hypothetical protein
MMMTKMSSFATANREETMSESIQQIVEAEEMRRLQRDRLAEDVDDGGPFVAVWVLGMAAIGVLGGVMWVVAWVTG